MKKRNLRVRERILIHILPFLAVTLLIISFLAYYQAKQIFLSNYKLQKEQFETNFYHTMLAIDDGYAMLEKNMEGDMAQRVLDFKAEFENAGGDPANISLDAMKAKTGNRYDFVILTARQRSSGPQYRTLSALISLRRTRRSAMPLTP
jgi:hypothetical protein